MKLNIAIAASYWGAEFIYSGSIGTVRRMGGISENHNLIDYPKTDTFRVDRCQLILTPLSKISDEDAVEVGKAFGLKKMDGHYYEWIGKAIITHHFTMYSPWDDSILDTASNRGLVTNIHSRNYLKLVDYLRSKGYDCGHGSIPSLIAAGVAVKKEQSKDADNQPDYKAQVRAVFPDSYIGKFEPDEFGVILHPDQDEDFMCVDTSKTEAGAWQLAYEKLKKKGEII